MNRFLLTLVTVVILLSSCHKNMAGSTSSSAPAPQAIQVTDTQSTLQGKLLFVNLEFSKTSSGRDTCILINTMTVDGVMKNMGSTHHHTEEGEEMILTFLSCAEQTLYEEHIDHPLNTSMDTYEENGQIQSGAVAFERREVGVRVQVQSTPFCYLRIEKRTKNTLELITTIKL